jgi:hypothetical protein
VNANGQSINIDFGPVRSAGPAASYAAAGHAGAWNNLPAFHNTFTHNLLGLDGLPTAVRLQQYGGTETLIAEDPETSGEADVLMDDYLVTYTPTLETCLFFRFLEYARYEIIVYARMPNQPTVMSYTSCDEEPGFPHLSIGGAWPGGHAQGVTFSRHFAASDPALGLLRVHSGIVPGANPADGAALNGIQLYKVRPGDVTVDGSVDVDDLIAVILAWGTCPGPALTCAADIAPYPTGNGTVDVDDLIAVILNWG